MSHIYNYKILNEELKIVVMEQKLNKQKYLRKEIKQNSDVILCVIRIKGGGEPTVPNIICIA